MTALALVMMLALGAAFLSQSTEYEPEIFSLLFGEILGVSRGQIVPWPCSARSACLFVGVLYRPLLLTSFAPEIAAAQGLRPELVDTAFLVVIACATTMTVPVVGALLIFTLMIGPPAAARCFTDRAEIALGLSVLFALVTVWAALACSYVSNWPVGFYVSVLSATWFAAGRGYLAWCRFASSATSRPSGSRVAVSNLLS